MIEQSKAQVQSTGSRAPAVDDSRFSSVGVISLAAATFFGMGYEDSSSAEPNSRDSQPPAAAAEFDVTASLETASIDRGQLASLNSLDASADLVAAGYLFAYFTGNGPGQEQVHFAISTDGFNYSALNGNRPVIDLAEIETAEGEKVRTSGGVRDPHILRGEHGNFYMVLTDLHVPEMGWQNYAMILSKSSDLVNWTHSIINIPESYPEKFGEVNRVWAPQTIYDQEKGKYMLYWSMRHDNGPDIIYYAYADEDFTALECEPQQLLFRDGACIDGDMICRDGKFHLFFKNEDAGGKGIMRAVSEKINEGFVVQEGYVDQTDDAVEGSGIFQLIDQDKYILMYDVYGRGRYEFCESTDLEHFEVIDEGVSMNFHPRHGAIISVTQEELERLAEKWGSPDSSFSPRNSL